MAQDAQQKVNLIWYHNDDSIFETQQHETTLFPIIEYVSFPTCPSFIPKFYTRTIHLPLSLRMCV